jgi:HemX protein
MVPLLNGLAALLPVLYLLAWADYAFLFFRDAPFARRSVTPVLVSVTGLHLVVLFLRAFALRRCPMGNLPEVLSVLALAVVVVYLALERRQGNKHTGVFLLTLVVPLVLIATLVTPNPRPVSPLLKSPLFGLHTLMALLGYSAFGVCAVYGSMYLMLHRSLKRQTFGLVFQNLPSLDGLAGLTVSAAVIGFGALTVTMMVGMFWGSRAIRSALLPGTFWHDPKILVTALVWVAYGIGISARFVWRWSNRPTVILLLAAFVVAVLAVVALNTVLHTFHNFTA